MKGFWISLFIIACLACNSARADETWSEGFENGIEQIKPYDENPQRAALQAVTADDAPEGGHYLRATLPGTSHLEGLHVMVKGLPKGRLASVTARVRGQGEIWPCLFNHKVWMHSPAPIPLTDQWQTVTASMVLGRDIDWLDVNYLSKSGTPAIFEIDDLRLSVAEPIDVPDASAGPVSIEAEDYCIDHPKIHITDDAGASNGKVAMSEGWMLLSDLPFPRTTKPVFVSMRIKPVSDGDEYQLKTPLATVPQPVSRVSAAQGGQWQWLTFPPVHVDEVGDTFQIESKAGTRDSGIRMVDRVVISTAELPEASLESAPALTPRKQP